ncbi:MAG: hypothetical protein ACLVKA_01600 [Collinsella aerofaciens]
MLAGTMEGGKATPTAYAAPSTITGKADIVITNKQQAYYEGAVAHARQRSIFRWVDAIAYGRCISGIHYAVPYDGTYDYVGTLQQDGVFIVIHSNTSGGANADAFLEGEMGTQQMGDPPALQPQGNGTVYQDVGGCRNHQETGRTQRRRLRHLSSVRWAKVTSITTDEHGHASCELTLTPHTTP